GPGRVEEGVAVEGLLVDVAPQQLAPALDAPVERVRVLAVEHGVGVVAVELDRRRPRRHGRVGAATDAGRHEEDGEGPHGSSLHVWTRAKSCEEDPLWRLRPDRYPLVMRKWDLLTAALDPHRGRPLFLQLSTAIANDIKKGRLRPGDALPGTRALAKRLGV